MEEDQTININSLLPHGLMGWLNTLLAAALPWVPKTRKVQVWMCPTQHETPELGKLKRSWDPRSITPAFAVICPSSPSITLPTGVPLCVTVKGFEMHKHTEKKLF